MAIFSRSRFKVCALLSWLCISLGAQAEAPLSITKTSQLINQTQINTPYYTLPTSAIRKVNGVIAAEYNLFLSGQLTSYTWQMTPGLSAKIAHDKALGELTMQSAQVLFQCEGRLCGSSNQWANQVFGESRLYGLDNQQAYAVLKQDTPEGPIYYALYSTQRGNKKVFLQLEMIQE